MAEQESEEVGFKRVFLAASNYNATVPIKKRRFPVIQSPPPPSKEIIYPPLDGNLIGKEQPCLSDGPTVSNSSTVTTSGLSDRNKICFSDESERKSDSCNANMVQSNIGPSRVGFPEDDSCFNGYMEYEEKSVVKKKLALHVLPKPELKLSPADPNLYPTLEPSADKESDEIIRKKLESKCKSAISLVKIKEELSVGLKEDLVTDMVPEESDWKCQKPNNLEPVSLDLSLSKQANGSQCVIGNVGCDYEGSLLQSNRENWDLNTSMESWEGSASESPVVQISASETPVVQISVTQMSTIVTTPRCSTGMVETDIPSGKQTLFSHNDNLHLSLCSSDLKPVVSQEQNSSVKLDLGRTNPNLSSPSRDMQFDDLNVAKKVVKPEPFVEGTKLDVKVDKVNALGLSDGAIVKCELNDECNLRTPKPLNICSPMRIVKAKSIKSEAVYDSQQEALKTSQGTLDQAAKQVQQESDSSCPIAMPVMAVTTDSARNPSRSTDLTTSMEKSNHSEQLTPIMEHLNMEVPRGGSGGDGLVNSEKNNNSDKPGSKDFSTEAINTSSAKDENHNSPDWCPAKLMNEPCNGLQGEESSVSDEEKISISADMLEEDSYGSEYESDGNQDVAKAVDAVDNDIEEDYEDGEVREPVLKTEIENNACQKREAEHFDYGDCDDKKINSAGQSGLDCSTLASVEQENKSECLDVKREDSVDTLTNNNSFEQVSEDFCLKDLLAEENTNREDLNKPIKTMGKRQLSHCEKKDALEHSDISSEKATEGTEELVVTVSQCEVENVKTVDSVQNDDQALPNVKVPVNFDDATKDVSGGSRHCRIINLSQTSTSSPSKTKPNLVRSVLSRTDRELIPDVGLEGGKFQHQGRDDIYSDVPQKISADGHQNLSPRMNFPRRRGRITNRIDSLHDEWDFDPDFSPGVYSGPMDYSVPRHKYASPVSDDDLEQTHYKITPDGPFSTAGRRGRQIVDDDGPPFCHIPSRRKSPSRRDGPHIRGVKMVHRIPRNISPSRCIGEAGSELVGQRHGEKFMRTFGDETMDPMYAHPQPPYEVDRPLFFRDRRNFSIQRKGFPRLDSKSPGRSRGRSPGQWFPSKRRSDRFCGRPGITRRSSPGYRMDRMRSPDQPPIRAEMGVRRHGYPFLSPPSNDMRDMGSARDHGHMRSMMPNRNQSDKLSFRNRRFDVMDPRDRIENDEYFGGPVHSGQLNELAGDGNDDDRRRFGDRHEPIHPFRPPYNDPDGENFHNNAEDCARPFRFCAEDEPEFHERGNNLREREFERRVKNQPGNLPRRTRVIDEHEVNYRHGRQLWNDHGFDDNMSRVKRKRF